MTGAVLMASLAVRRAGGAAASTSLDRAGGAQNGTSGGGPSPGHRNGPRGASCRRRARQYCAAFGPAAAARSSLCSFWGHVGAGDAAVHKEGRGGDEGGVVAGEEGDRGGDLLR